MQTTFSLSFDKFVDSSIKKTEQAIRKTVVDLTSAIISDTPVDTGRLKANWLVSIENEDNRKLESADKSGNATIEKAKAVVARPIGKGYYIQNNLEYAAKIEYGASTRKAPLGMVRVNIAKFSAILKSNTKG